MLNVFKLIPIIAKLVCMDSSSPYCVEAMTDCLYDDVAVYCLEEQEEVVRLYKESVTITIDSRCR